MPPTPLRFQPLEPLRLEIANTLPSTLQTTNPLFYKALVLRLLTGTLDIECSLTGKIIKQRVNYFALSNIKSRVARRTITNAITPFTFNEFDLFILRTNNNNFQFYRDIYFEFNNYFFQKEAKNEVLAFIHLYRVLERVAYCFPLMWAARARNYEQTFDKLKLFFSDPKIGELGIFKKFISEFIDNTAKQIQTTLNIHSLHPDWQSRYYNILSQIIGRLKISDPARPNRTIQYTPHSFTPNSQIVIHFEVLIDLIIEVRNRFFHALTGHSNSFNCEEIVDANEFFRILNESTVTWLSYITSQIMEFERKQ